MGSDFEFMKSQVERFQKLGFRVWMDDFGSGYSSLDVLQNLKFDLIKLDMHFMRQFGQDDRSRIIITELIKMALSLGFLALRTVALGRIFAFRATKLEKILNIIIVFAPLFANSQ